MIKFIPVNLKVFLRALKWRNENLKTLRTPYPLTEEMQYDFYKNNICIPNSDKRFWGVVDSTSNEYVALVGLVNIEWENRLGEISLIGNSESPSEEDVFISCEELILDELLYKGFFYLNLYNIYGEMYHCSDAIYRRVEMIKKYSPQQVILPNRKYWDNEYWDSLYFNINKENFVKYVETNSGICKINFATNEY